MRSLRVGIVDLVSRGPTRALFMRFMGANLASLMPQVVGVWCREAGHQVTYVCYTGSDDLLRALPDDLDLVFICAFTEAAQTAYALSNFCRARGAVTVLGGPHARCYPHDARRYFDYVLGFTDREVIGDVLADLSQHRPYGIHLTACQQPRALPSVRDRWQFIEPLLGKVPFVKIVIMLSSLGCPYTCSFCIDSVVPYQPLSTHVLKEDLRFLRTKFRSPIVAWHDPNFGVRFNDTLDSLEDAVPPGSVRFIAESSLSLLGEPHLKRLKRNGFKAILPGIESWYDLGGKSHTGGRHGIEKVRQVSDHINQILRYIPYVQANFVLGLDSDKGAEPFELTKRFLDRTPGVFPGYSLLTAFGQAPPLNLEYQRVGRVLPFPFHFLNNNEAMNVRPKNYEWGEFYEHVIDLTKYSFSWRALFNRFRATRGLLVRWMNLLRSVSSEGFGRLRYYSEIRRRLDADPEFAPYFGQQTTKLPRFYVEVVRKDLGPLWQWLPEGGMEHDPNAYLKSTGSSTPMDNAAPVPESAELVTV